MAHIDVKITDLAPVTELENKDLFLVSHPILDSSGALEETPYTSNCISAAALSGAIKGALEKDSLNVSGKWEFHTSSNNLPTQDFRYAIGDFLNALKDSDHLASIVNDGSGWYHDLPTSFVQDTNKRSGTAQSLSVTNNSIANIDVVQRTVAGAYQDLFRYITRIINGEIIPSYVGMIIHSTTLNTEAAVKARYGGNTWIRHAGYFLRGASSGVSAGNEHNKKDNGEDSTKYSIPLKKHTHELKSNAANGVKISVTASGSIVKSVSSSTAPAEVNPSESGKAVVKVSTNSYKAGNTIGSGTINFGTDAKTNLAGDSNDPKITVSHLPSYKNVYIWERVS